MYLCQIFRQAGGYTFEWGGAKQQKTQMSRGIDFADLAIFDWHAAITRADSRWDYGEARFSLTHLCFTYDLPMVCLWFAYGLAIKKVTSPATCGVDRAWVGPNIRLAVAMKVWRSA